jgi:hypothetical protein
VPATDSGTRSHVVLQAPTSPGTYSFSITWDRSVSPAGSNDGSAFRTTPTSVSFTMTVPNNAAPVLTVPASFTIEGDTTGGWTADWSGVTATDAEDDPDPTPTCSPAAGTVLPTGVTTNVSCSVTDSGNRTATGGFSVTVTDTTKPVIVGLPSNQTLTTTDPAGAAATWTDPTATDVVDASPTVACTPASGTSFPVGGTTVTCTATDASGNAATGSFTITVDLATRRSASAIWLEPVAGSGSTFVANHGRTIPVKVRMFVDGVERTSGDAVLSVAPCGGATTDQSPMAWSGGRWNVSVDTSRLSAACWTVTASIDGTVAGAFTLELRGDSATGPTGRSPTVNRSAKPGSSAASVFRTPRGNARGR